MVVVVVGGLVLRGVVHAGLCAHCCECIRRSEGEQGKEKSSVLQVSIDI